MSSEKGLADFPVCESVAPFIKAVVATGSAQDACRAVHMKGTSANVTLTVNGSDVAFHLPLPGPERRGDLSRPLPPPTLRSGFADDLPGRPG